MYFHLFWLQYFASILPWFYFKTCRQDLYLFSCFVSNNQNVASMKKQTVCNSFCFKFFGTISQTLIPNKIEHRARLRNSKLKTRLFSSTNLILFTSLLWITFYCPQTIRQPPSFLFSHFQSKSSMCQSPFLCLSKSICPFFRSYSHSSFGNPFLLVDFVVTLSASQAHRVVPLSCQSRAEFQLPFLLSVDIIACSISDFNSYFKPSTL